MHFLIDPAILQKYPHLHIGLLVCTGVRNGPASAELTAMLRRAEQGVRSQFSDPEAVKAHPTIAAWQQAHQAFGSNPNKFPSSIHALCNGW